MKLAYWMVRPSIKNIKKFFKLFNQNLKSKIYIYNLLEVNDKR